jgi:hypothetical protein
MISKAVRNKVLQRDNNQCWHCGEVEAISIQHRRGRGMGGSKLLDRLDNLIVLCSSMNSLIESDADQASYAKDFGWKLASWDSFEMPVFNKNEGKWYQLGTTGDKTEVEAPGYLI